MKRFVSPSNSLDFRSCPLKVPHVYGVEVDLHKLYEAVMSMGGWQKVSMAERWTDVARIMGFSEEVLNADHATKLLYMRYLSKFEQCETIGDVDDHDSDMLGTRSRGGKGFSSFATADCPISLPKPGANALSGPSVITQLQGFGRLSTVSTRSY